MQYNLWDAAKEGTLNQIPKELLTEESLLAKSEHGQNCFHFAAMCGHLHQIPKEFLTEKNLLIKSTHEKCDCFQAAAYRRNLNKIPREFLTPKNLLKEDEYGASILRDFADLQKYQKDISAVIGAIPLREWVPYLNKLKILEERRKIGIIKELREKVEAYKKVKEIPSLKI